MKQYLDTKMYDILTFFALNKSLFRQFHIIKTFPNDKYLPILKAKWNILHYICVIYHLKWQRKWQVMLILLATFAV